MNMDFLITAGAWKKQGFEAHKAGEDQVVAELRAEGVLTAAYRRADGGGVFGIFHVADLAEAKAQVARLPFVAHGFLEFEFAEIVSL
jgi:muconolactone delta-isomerase